MQTGVSVLHRKGNANHGKLSQLQYVFGLRLLHKKAVSPFAPKSAHETVERRIAVVHLSHCLKLVTVKIY